MSDPPRETTTTTRRRCRRRAILTGAPIGLISAFVLFQTACTTFVTPPDPASLREPVSIYLVDYHRHSSLMLPTTGSAETVLREYAYGEWGWFAENRTGGARAAGALLVPSRGALGRADHPMPADAEELRQLHGFEAVHELRVEGTLVRSLLERLDRRFESRLDTMTFNPSVGLDLIQDDDRYSLANHCNHATVGWLRELGVHAAPVTAVARFRVRPPPIASQSPPPPPPPHSTGPSTDSSTERDRPDPARPSEP